MTPPNHTRLHTLRRSLAERTEAMAELAPRYSAIANRHENGTAPRAVVAHQLFQTPAPLAARLVALLGDLTGKRVLEPSAGLGRILTALTAHPAARPAEITAVEIASGCTIELARQAHPATTIRCRDFLTCTEQDIGTFDAIAMNPPFTMRSDIRHIRHALTLLRPGGILAALCMAGEHRHAALQPIASTWEPVAAGAFSAENTGVATVLLSIRK